MNNFFSKLKNLLYSLPFGLKAADTEIMGSNVSCDGNDTVLKQQVNDKRVAKHLLKGEVTKEVSELRYRTYKVARETDKYDYVGNGIAIKKDEKKKSDTISFSQENKMICNDVLTELKRVGSYGVEKYTVNIEYISPVRFKLQEFLTLVDVVIKNGKKAVTTLHFNDIKNPQVFASKPFISELEKLDKLFHDNDTYGLSKNDFATSIICMGFTTFKATDEQPDVVSYSFISPKLIDVKHENGEYKIVYQWEQYNRIDLTDKFYNPELEEKYNKKEKKPAIVETEIKDASDNNNWWNEHYEKTITCSKCGKKIKVFYDGYAIDKKTSEPICLKCYEKSLLEKNK